VSLYVPSGSASDVALARKDGFMEPFYEHLTKLRRKRREFIICADWNTCHQNIDLKNWRSNQKNSGFMPHERAWLDRIYDRLGWVDIFREITDEADLYTWWSNRGQAWANNVGWRLDYMLATPGLSGTGRRQSIYRDERFSDHAPLTIDFDISKPG
jgi:exodeoxyribonuclease-3